MRTRLHFRLPTALVCIGITACVHSEPPSIAGHGSDRPFSFTPPVRLTWSELAEMEPGFSADGNWITYVFERDGDRDRCIGVLPATGGTRVRTICAWELDEASSRDGMSAPGLSREGRMIFTRQFGRMFVMPNDSSALYLDDADPGTNPVKISDLPVNLPGSARSWPDLMAPVWISENELLTLTAQRYPYWGTGCVEDCPKDLTRTRLIDTLRLGIELARIRFDGTTPTLLATFPTPHASAWTHDASTGTTYVLLRTVDPVDVTFLESTSDTIYRVSPGGSSREVVFGVDRLDHPAFSRIHGIAASQGRLYASLSWPGVYDTASVRVPPGLSLNSLIVEILPDGTRRTVANAVSHHWGDLAASPDGRKLVAESINLDGSSDLYLIGVDP